MVCLCQQRRHARPLSAHTTLLHMLQASNVTLHTVCSSCRRSSQAVIVHMSCTMGLLPKGCDTLGIKHIVGLAEGFHVHCIFLSTVYHQIVVVSSALLQRGAGFLYLLRPCAMSAVFPPFSFALALHYQLHSTPMCYTVQQGHDSQSP